MDNILNSDNGIITAALKVYADTAMADGAPQYLIDRANDLYFIFLNKPASETYDWPTGGYGKGQL